MSDVFGELVDLTNGRGTDTPATRWQLGEDLPAGVGVIRNMEDPTLFNDPDRMTSARYVTDGDQLDWAASTTTAGSTTGPRPC